MARTAGSRRHATTQQQETAKQTGSSAAAKVWPARKQHIPRGASPPTPQQLLAAKDEQLQRLAADKASMRDSLIALRPQVREQAAAIAAKEAAIAASQEQLAHERAAAAAAKAAQVQEMEAAAALARDCAQQLAHKTARLAAVSGQVLRQQEGNQLLRQQVKALQQQVAAADHKAAEMRQQLTSAHAILEGARQEVQDVSSVLSAVQAQQARTAERLAESQQARGIAEAGKVALEEWLGEMQEQQEQAAADIATLRQQLHDTTAALAEQRAASRAASIQHNRVQGAAAAATEQVAELKHQLTLQASRTEAARAETRGAVFQMGRLHARNRTLARELSDVRSMCSAAAVAAAPSGLGDDAAFVVTTAGGGLSGGNGGASFSCSRWGSFSAGSSAADSRAASSDDAGADLSLALVMGGGGKQAALSASGDASETFYDAREEWCEDAAAKDEGAADSDALARTAAPDVMVRVAVVGREGAAAAKVAAAVGTRDDCAWFLS